MSVLIAPMVVPIVVVGVSTYLFFAPLGLVDSYTGLIIVHAALGAPFVLTTVLRDPAGLQPEPRARQPEPRREPAARPSSASPCR